MDCKHERIECNASVARLTNDSDSNEIIGYATDIKVKCAQCGIPFEWIGIGGGYSPTEPKVNFDRTELRAPIRPSTDPVEHANALLNKKDSGLKSVAYITDEDALTVAKIFGGLPTMSYDAIIHQVKEVLKGRYNKVTNIPGMKWHEAIEYLKQNGYDIW